MKKTLLFLTSLFFSSSLLFAQETIERCSTMEVDALLRANNPQIGTLDEFEEWLAPKVQEYKNSVQAGNAKKMVYNIPVIIHIIHNSNESVGAGRNISNAQAVSQIDVLNEDFRKLNSDFSSVPSVFQSVAADCEINFCLAKYDPQGNLLNEVGIERIDITSLGYSDLSSTNTSDGFTSTDFDTYIKPNTYWDPTKYLNMWVAQMGPTGTGGQLLGYATFPESSGLPGISFPTTNEQLDGVVMHYRAFGKTGNLMTQFPLGRTATHEVGHWLGLRHIWGDATCGDDFCSDTPTQEASNSGCPTHPSPSCTNSGDMFYNYMDYSDDACLNLFTEDQKVRMMAVLQNSPRRGELNSSTVCGSCKASTSDQNFSDIDTPSLYEDNFGSPAWGWISGHNSFEDKAKCEEFMVQSTFHLTGVEIYFAKAFDASGSGTVKVSVWNDNGGFNNEPTNIITSEDFPISAINIGDPSNTNPTYIPFSTPPYFNVMNGGRYYVGIELNYGTSQDTIAIYTNADGETTAPETAWEQWSDDTWHQFHAGDSWNKSVSLLIMPELCSNVVSVEEFNDEENNIVVYPNPSKGVFKLNTNGTIIKDIMVFNMLGEKSFVKSYYNSNELLVDLSNFPDGIYFLNIKTDSKYISKKLILSK